MTSLIILDQEMDIIMAIGKSLKESGLLMKRVSRTTKKEKKRT